MPRFRKAVYSAAVLVICSLIFGSELARAGTAPEAPSNVQALGGVLSWLDNSDNEDGFRITLRSTSDLTDEVAGTDLDVGVNVTSLTLPEEAQIRCPDRTSISFKVVAFNEAGSSAPAATTISVLCPATGQPTTVQPTIGLPQTGSGGASDNNLWIPLMAFAASAAAFAIAMAAIMRRS